MKRILRRVDNDVYIPVLKEIIESGKDVNLLISGSSMAPFLCHCRDTIIISKPNGLFKKGDMVFYQRDTGRYIMHRIHHIDEKGMLYIVGDNQTMIEGPVRPDQVFGIIHKVIRKNRILQKGDFWWDFFEKIWIRIVPLRPYIMKLYGMIKKGEK